MFNFGKELCIDNTHVGILGDNLVDGYHRWWAKCPFLVKCLVQGMPMALHFVGTPIIWVVFPLRAL